MTQLRRRRLISIRLPTGNSLCLKKKLQPFSPELFDCSQAAAKNTRGARPCALTRASAVPEPQQGRTLPSPDAIDPAPRCGPSLQQPPAEPVPALGFGKPGREAMRTASCSGSSAADRSESNPCAYTALSCYSAWAMVDLTPRAAQARTGKCDTYLNESRTKGFWRCYVPVEQAVVQCDHGQNSEITGRGR